MLNLVQIIGNLGADPETRSLSSGSRVVNLRLAVSERWKDASSGERKERTEWIPVTIWDEKLGEIAEKYLRKGSKCFVQGQFQTRKWTDQSGADRYSTEVVLNRFRGQLVLLDSRRDGDAAAEPARSSSAPARDRAPRGGGIGPSWSAAGNDLSDEIPF